MAEISKLNIPAGANGAYVEYDIKDSTARSSIPAAATDTPQAPGTAAVGSSSKYAKEDHVHPGYANATTTAAGLMSASDKTKLDSLSGVAISDSEPTDSNTNVWIDPDDADVGSVPQIDDTQISANDTFSSQKIHGSYLSFDSSQTLTEGQMAQLYANMGFPSNTAGKLGYTVIIGS
jgi:hypothetical protein